MCANFQDLSSAFMFFLYASIAAPTLLVNGEQGRSPRWRRREGGSRRRSCREDNLTISGNAASRVCGTVT
jgi:hypothetical protein